ncbi:hypothetical protein K504DRAFT_500663 [Pleomassaria siparia CBS 279.74]|uniref:Uncharacterized protein n=1 Tax=Pleomassaria siparia CBS 279.74 TaxID=1314801 RepID=A0A6G1KCT9_9PLEO|nr:hypothetical protein K504DRAFT_500663 [Pleomassaria siparia CBS 279.74]
MSPSFSGPVCKSLSDFNVALSNIPATEKADATKLSNATLAAICNTSHLHIWESDSDIDNLLQLTHTIVMIRTTAGASKATGANEQATGKNRGPGMVIITEVKSGHDNFARVCELVKHLTDIDGRMHLENSVCAFGGIVVVRGVDNRHAPTLSKDGSFTYLDDHRKEMDTAVRRINIAIERVFKLHMFSSLFNRKIVWHHGPVIHFLLHWINNTTSSLRDSLAGITICAALDFSKGGGIQPSTLGRTNAPQHLAKLEEYVKRLDISATFLDNDTQMINYEYLTTYMYFFGYYINMFLPASLARPHLHRAQDRLITFAFRLWGACNNTYESDVVKTVQNNLDRHMARPWASMCINPKSYTKSSCQAAAKDEEIHHAVQLADAPFETFGAGNGMRVPAFARLMVGPGQVNADKNSVATPFKISLSASSLGQFRIEAPSAFRLLTPLASSSSSSTTTQTSLTPANINPKSDSALLEMMTGRIRGIMMAVLERLRQDKGNPTMSEENRATWKEIGKAVAFALGGCKGEGRLPKGVGEKIAFVQAKLVEGTWGYSLGAQGVGQTHTPGQMPGYQGVGQ